MPFGKFDNRPAEQMSNGWAAQINCDASSNAIYLHRGDLGVVRRYDDRGTLIWETTLPSFAPAWFIAQGRGAAVLFPRNQIVGVHVAGRTRLLVHVSTANYERGRAVRRGMTVQPGIDGYIWYVIDAASGRLVAKSDGRIPLTSLSATLVAEFHEEPWPMMRLRPAQVVSP